ncbi:MAG: methyltransferase domain-containing protein [Streptosporangiales bacterium]|nr:methyltransferase domain-containing protein [Streptosporangiales bacterium]
MLDDVVDYLVCPICAGEMAVAGATLRCPDGHSFDIARQGYANLLPGGARPHAADTAAMIQAREEFLGAGHFAALADLLADRAAASVRGAGGCVVDVGAGTGYFLATVLNRLSDHVGLAVDLSKHAARRAARAHPRIGAAVCDAWRPLPVRSGAASLVLNVCAPRNGAEFRRVLRPGGALLVATPAADHLVELVEPLGLLSVDPRKGERVGAALDDHFETIGHTAYETGLRLARHEVEALVRMGPSAYHVDPAELADRVAALPEPVAVTASFTVTTMKRRYHRPRLPARDGPGS